jgi:hypothetical protein
MVSNENNRAPWLSYEVKTLREAIGLFSQFQVLPSHHWRATFSELCPESVFSEKQRAKYNEPDSGPWACWITVDHGAKYGPSAELKFYALLPIGPAHICVRFGNGYIGECLQLRAIPEETRGRGDRLISRKFQPNAEARGASDKVISWASYEGPIAKTARHSYLFCADRDEMMLGAEHSHTTGMLEILAERAGV